MFGVLAAAMPAGAVTPPAAAASALAWKRCADPAQRGFQCATLRVPLDYGDPGGRTIRLAVVRRPATDRKHRIGTLFFNFGGPGAAGASLLPLAPIPAALRARFDIASWDPRGVGASTAVQCFASPQAESAFLDDVTLSFPVGRVQMGAWLDRYAQLYRRCDRRNGDLLRHVSTADTARDLNRLRRAVGDRRLNYDGFSYGTFLGATYANLFPDRVRAMVLDANLDPQAYVGREIDANGGRFLSTDLRTGSDLSSAETLNAFLDLCGSADAAHCAFTAGSPEATRAKYADLLTRLRTDPRSATLTYAQVVSITGNDLYSVASWPSLATTLQDLWTTGDAAPPTAIPGQQIGQAFAIRCSESPNPGPAAFPSLDAFAYQRAGPIGPYWSWTSAACASWRAKAADRYSGPWDRRTAHPVLVVNNTYDPASPYRAAVAMARRLARARLLTVDGYGHIVGTRSTCATRYIDRYLIRIKLPPAGTRCRQDRPPFGPGP
ncbi:alpha/beta fold hydrolase [Capillimicrobium parvum]|uniref:Carboxylesterase B n=1 Tax=Capillimicrobium parvum TaxID=2884022 RepID=A0A9E7C204_9ACTN|nr:alpha/beta hydrolase [Capillimicrobium parvum]UGS38040.1 Carboxylesterase B [Capillimicrobium parvum]